LWQNQTWALNRRHQIVADLKLFRIDRSRIGYIWRAVPAEALQGSGKALRNHLRLSGEKLVGVGRQSHRALRLARTNNQVSGQMLKVEKS